MKKVLFILVALIGVLSSCEKEDLRIDNEEEVLIGIWNLNAIHRDAGYHLCNPDGDAVYCHGITQEGRGCHNKTTNRNGYCYLHGGQDNGTYNYSYDAININSRQGVINFLETTSDRQILECLQYEWRDRYFSDFKIYKQNNIVYGSTKSLVHKDITWTHTQLPISLCQYGDEQDNGYILFGEIQSENYYLFYCLEPGEQILNKEKLYKYKYKFSDDTYSSFDSEIYEYERLGLSPVSYDFVLYFDKQ